MNTDRDIALGVALFHATQLPPPFDVRQIGSGCYRTAYLAYDTVYKVGYVGNNSEEADKVRAIRPRMNWTSYEGYTVRIPDCVFMEWDKGDGVPRQDSNSVSIMEYAGDGCQFTNCDSTYKQWNDDYTEMVTRPCSCEPWERDGTCWGTFTHKIKNDWDIGDIHSENVLYQPRTHEVWAIDLQY